MRIRILKRIEIKILNCLFLDGRNMSEASAFLNKLYYFWAAVGGEIKLVKQNHATQWSSPECSHFTLTELKDTGAAPLFKAFVSFLLLIILPFFFLLYILLLSQSCFVSFFLGLVPFCDDIYVFIIVKIKWLVADRSVVFVWGRKCVGVISLELCWVFSAHGSECLWIK